MSKLQSKSQKTYIARGITGSLGIMALCAVTVGVANGADSDAAEDTLINKGLGFIETLASEVAENLPVKSEASGYFANQRGKRSGWRDSGCL